MNKKRTTAKYFNYTNVESDKLLINRWNSTYRFKHVDALTVFFCDFRKEFLDILYKLSKDGKRKLTVVGCVAWLSDPAIVEGLVRFCGNVFILVNNENFSVWGNGKTHLLYDQFPWCLQSMSELFSHLDDVYKPLTACGSFAPVRCIQNDGTGHHLMHNKYVVFLLEDEKTKSLQCDSVWLGSVNFTKNSSNNLETATYIEDSRVATAVFHDFSNLFVISTPLTVSQSTTWNNWSSEKSNTLLGREDKFTFCDEKKRYVYKG